MIRSAKMNAITPPKLMPPFHSTAASGTLPTEQTKLKTATSGPMIGPQTFANVPWWVRKSERHHESGTQAASIPAATRPIAMSRRTAAHSITNTWDGGGEPRRRAQLAPHRAVASDGHVHFRVALHRAEPPAVGLLARLADEPAGQEQPEEQSEEDDHQRAADELAERELPAEHDRHQDPELDDEVRRGELEDDRGGEVGALAEERARKCDRRIRARRRRDSQRARSCERARRIVGHQPLDALLRHECLHDRREQEPENERPEDLPGHPEREAERTPELVRDVEREH